ncbi:MAG: RpoL/Rpb11 RNA polymerase subunit family protein [Candidatus Aenigmatarchaeota archaeon]
MEIKVLEQTDDKVKLEIDSLTLANLLNNELWKQKIEWAAWSREHPYLSKPVLAVKAKDPKKALIAAAEQIQADAEALKKAFAKAAKD